MNATAPIKKAVHDAAIKAAVVRHPIEHPTHYTSIHDFATRLHAIFSIPKKSGQGAQNPDTKLIPIAIGTKS